MAPEMNVQLFGIVTVLLSYISVIVRNSSMSFQLIYCKLDSPPKWQNHRKVKAAPKL